MQPLVLRDIASELDLHESTVSRVTSRKYVQTPRGVFELKYFFSNQVATAERRLAHPPSRSGLGYGKSSTRRSPDSPGATSVWPRTSSEAGFRVARRTVAKYRESMGIPPSNERRRTGAVHLNVSA